MRFLCVLCVLCGFVVSAFALDREAFTITNYELDVRLEPEQQRLGARGKITVRNDSGQPQKTVALQISSSLSWKSIQADGKPVQFVAQPYVSDIDHTGELSEALVTLPAEVKPKNSAELEIGYEGIIPLDATRLTRVGVPEQLAKHTSWDQISSSFTAVRGAGYVVWYPITTASADFSEGNSLFEVVNRWKAWESVSEFHAKVELVRTDEEESATIACSGAAIGSAELSKDRNVQVDCVWKSLGAVAPAFVAAPYSVLSKPPLKIYALAGHEAGATTYLRAFGPASEFVTPWFGKLTTPVTVADLADPHAPPFESGTLLLASMAAEDSKLAGINLVHELTHSALWSPRPWVYEGLAHFGEAMYREEQGGRQAALDLLGIHRSTLVEAEKDVSASAGKNAGQPLAVTFDEIYYRSKAAYVWWMLRDLVGDDALKAVIAKYRAADDKDPKYVEQLVSSASKRDLSWFFDDWVYHDRGLPDIGVQSAHPWKTDKATMITVTLENRGAAGAEVSFTVRCEGGDVTARLEVRGKSTATTRMQLPGAPTEIVVNDGSVPESDLSNNVFRIGAAEGSQKSEVRMQK